MDIRQISPTYAVSPQISVEDIALLKHSGFTTIICNRPDNEIPPSHHASVIEAATTAAGLTFVLNPVTHHGLNMDMVAQQKAAITRSEGPALAYCASGTRSSIVWSLAFAGEMPSEEIIAATHAAGYDLRNLKDQLEAIASS